MVTMTEEGSTKIVNSMTPGGGGSKGKVWPSSDIVTTHYFFKIFFFTPRQRSDKLSS